MQVIRYGKILVEYGSWIMSEVIYVLSNECFE